MPEKPLGTAEVRVEVDTDLWTAGEGQGADQGEELRSSLQACLAGLLQDLALPVMGTVHITHREGQAFSSAPCAMAVNGRRCRIPLTENPPVSFDELGPLLAEALYRNRELLLPRSLAEKILGSWAAESHGHSASPMQPDQFHELLLLLVRSHFRATRARPLLEAAPSVGREREAAGLFEEVAAEDGALALSVSTGALRCDRYTIQMIGGELFRELGLVTPEVEVSTDTDLGVDGFRIRVNDLRLPARRAQEGELQAAVKETIACEATSLLNMPVVLRMLAAWELTRPALVRAASGRFEPERLARVFRYLLQERIPVRDVGTILEALLAVCGTTGGDYSRLIVLTPNPALLWYAIESREPGQLADAELADCVRMRLDGVISYQYGGRENFLRVLLLSSDAESRLMELDESQLRDEDGGRLAAEVLWTIGYSSSLRPVQRPQAVLTTAEVRRKVQGLLATELPWLPVLSYQELSPDMSLKVVARLFWLPRNWLRTSDV